MGVYSTRCDLFSGSFLIETNQMRRRHFCVIGFVNTNPKLTVEVEVSMQMPVNYLSQERVDSCGDFSKLAQSSDCRFLIKDYFVSIQLVFPTEWEVCYKACDNKFQRLL